MINKVNLSEVMLENMVGGHASKRALVKKDEVRNPAILYVNEVYLPAGKAISSQGHKNIEEIIFVLLGGGVLAFGQTATKVKTGDRLIVPPDIAHSLKNTGKSIMKYLCFGIGVKALV